MVIIEEAIIKSREKNQKAWTLEQIGKQQMHALKEKNGKTTTSREQLPQSIMKTIHLQSRNTTHLHTSDLPDITVVRTMYSIEKSTPAELPGNSAPTPREVGQKGS